MLTYYKHICSNNLVHLIYLTMKQITAITHSFTLSTLSASKASGIVIFSNMVHCQNSYTTKFTNLLNKYNGKVRYFYLTRIFMEQTCCCNMVCHRWDLQYCKWQCLWCLTHTQHLHWYMCGAVMEERTDIESISILLPPSVIVGVPMNKSNNQMDQTTKKYAIQSLS